MGFENMYVELLSETIKRGEEYLLSVMKVGGLFLSKTTKS